MTVTIDWVEIPKGKFKFGIDAEWVENATQQLTPADLTDLQEIKRYKVNALREAPPRQIYLPTYYISRYPVTWQQLFEFAQTNYWNSTNTGIHPNVIDRSYKKKEELASKLAKHPADVLRQTALTFCNWIGGSDFRFGPRRVVVNQL